MLAPKVTTQFILNQGFKSVHTANGNEVEFSKIQPDTEAIKRIRISRNVLNGSVLMQEWDDNYSNGEKEGYRTGFVTPGSPRIKAALGMSS